MERRLREEAEGVHHWDSRRTLSRERAQPVALRKQLEMAPWVQE